jgi:hypothetical protein
MAIVLVRPSESVEGDVDAEEDGVDEGVTEEVDGVLTMTEPDEMEADGVVEALDALVSKADAAIWVSLVSSTTEGYRGT